MEDNCEDKPSKKKFGIGIGGGASVRNFIFKIQYAKYAKTAERGGGGKVKQWLEKFGNLSNGTYDENVGVKKTIPLFERPGSVILKKENCSKPMAECLQINSCERQTTNLVKSGPTKSRIRTWIWLDRFSKNI